jgi:putative oxidoreductase
VAIKDDKLRDVGVLVLRIGLGGVLLYYGLQKAFGAFDGPGFQRTLDFFQSHYGFPRWLGSLAILSEFAGSIGVLLGLLTRVAALGMACTMAVAAFEGVTRPGMLSDLMNGAQSAPPAILYPSAMMFMALSLMLTGPGGISVDAKLFKRGKK